jgi:hypothetical protein
MKLHSVASIAFSVMLLVASGGLAQATPDPVEFIMASTDLQHSLSRLDELPNLTATEKEAVTAAKASLDFLNQNWSINTIVSDPYLASLKYDNRVIMAAYEYSAERRLRAILFVRDDTGAKEENCRANRGASTTASLGKDVMVSATTKLSGASVKGYDVMWAWAFLLDQEKPLSLNTQSSPAVGMVPPGLIMFWARKNGVDLPESRKPIRVGAGAPVFDLTVSR